MTTDRNAAMSSSTDSTMTKATTSSKRAEISPAVSIEAAVCPPIRAVIPGPAVARGTTVAPRGVPARPRGGPREPSGTSRADWTGELQRYYERPVDARAEAAREQVIGL